LPESRFRENLRRHNEPTGFAVSLCLTITIYLLGWLTFIESPLIDLRFLNSDRLATGDVVIVEIDAKSLAEIGIWPWPRGHYARVIENIQKHSPRLIAVDVDFSSKSTTAEDQKLASVLRTSSAQIFLPAFKQFAYQENGSASLIYTAPIKEFREQAKPASINVRPDSDGLIRKMPRHDDWQGQSIPTMASALAQHLRPTGEPYYVDYGISLGSIPRISFSNILLDHFDPTLITGKSVIIGATAVELGDHLSVPRYRAVSGAALQALASETLIQGRDLYRVPPVTSLIYILIFSLLIWFPLVKLSWKRSTLVLPAFWILSGVTAYVFYAQFSILFDLAPLIVISILFFAFGLISRINFHAFQEFLSRMSATHQEALLTNMVKSSSDAIFIENYEGVITSANPAAEKLFNLDSEEIGGESIGRLIPILKEDKTSKSELATSGAPTEVIAKKSNGSTFPVEILVTKSVFEVSDCTHERRQTPRPNYIYSIRDISRRKQAERKLIEAKQEAEDASRAKSEFLASMSHDLRTPLNAIIGFSDVMKSKIFGPLGNPRYVDYVQNIHDSGLFLISLIDDILDLSKIEAGKYELTNDEIDICEQINDAMQMLSPSAELGKITVNCISNFQRQLIRVDQRAVLQILNNLLSNAIKFTPAGGSVTISTDISRSGTFDILVVDTGIGMDKEEIAKALKPFEQIDSERSRMNSGTGLGLHICQLFMHLHGGTLTIDSVKDMGTSVILRFPPERIVNNKPLLQSENPAAEKSLK